MTAVVEVIKDPYFMINSVDLTAQCQEVALNFSIDEVETTASGDGCHVYIPGLEKPSASVKLLKNYGTGSVDATLWAAKGSLVAVKMRRKQAAKGASNPEYTFTGFIGNVPLISGGVGQAEECNVNLVLNTIISRDAT